jgi:DNA primase
MKDPLVTRRGIIIPFTYRDQVVGWTKRFLDDRNPRYLSDAQPGYVFNVDSIKDSWTQVIVTEGIFDALSIGGVAVMHNDINDAQARLIRNLGKEITVVPDQDKTGLDLIDRAMELGWAVSIPDWGDCKDVNDAVIKYGHLATLITIMQSRETSRIKIELRKRQLAKRLSI